MVIDDDRVSRGHAHGPLVEGKKDPEALKRTELFISRHFADPPRLVFRAEEDSSCGQKAVGIATIDTGESRVGGFLARNSADRAA